MPILRVNPVDVTALWDQVQPLITSALRDIPTHDAEDVRGAILAGTSTLFIQFREVVEAIAVTQFAAFPKGIWLSIWLVGARPDYALDDAAFLDVMTTFQEINGCRGFQYTGARQGWIKRFPGFKLEGVNLRQTLHERQNE